MLTFNYIEGGYEVTGQIEPLETDIIIPSTFDDGVNGEFPVTSIGDSAFRENQLTSVTIPNSVTSIGGSAFTYNQLTSVVIPDSVTSIGIGAFGGNQLTSVVIPDSVESIERQAFYQNQLTSVTIGNSVTSIGIGAFGENQLTSVVIPDSVTSIGSQAFYSNQLTSVTIPNSVESIDTYAFYINQLTSITIPNSVTSIGMAAFSYNQLTSVTIPDSVESIERQAFYQNQLTSVVWKTTAQIEPFTFEGSKITSFTITSNSLVSLADIGDFDSVTVENPMTVYVQPQLIEDYKIATNWVTLYNEGRATFEPIPTPITKLKPYLTAIKEAIQFKDGTTGNVNVQDMPQMIRDIPSGGGGNGLTYNLRTSTPEGSKAILTQDGEGFVKAILQEGLSKLEGDLYQMQSLVSIEIPNSVVELGEYCIGLTMIEDIVIPATVTNVNANAFAVSYLKKVIWHSPSSIKHNTFNDEYGEFDPEMNMLEIMVITSSTFVSLQNTNAFRAEITSSNPITIYVPSDLIATYQTATNWTTLFNTGRCDFVDIALAPTE